MRHRLAGWMRKMADRLSPETAFRSTHMSFSFQDRVGILVHGADDVGDKDGGGTRLWYRTNDYWKAHK